MLFNTLTLFTQRPAKHNRRRMASRLAQIGHYSGGFSLIIMISTAVPEQEECKQEIWTVFQTIPSLKEWQGK